MRLHIFVLKGVLGFALAGLVVGRAAQAQDKEAARAQKDAADDTRRCIKHVKRNTKQANKPHKPKICPFCVPPLPTNGEPRGSGSQILPPAGRECGCPPTSREDR